MTKLETGCGVRCDLCGMRLVDSFVYFNYDLVRVFISRKCQPSPLHIERKPEKQVDLCGNCNDNFTVKVVENNTKRLKTAHCELTGRILEDGPACMVFITLVSVVSSPTIKTNIDSEYLSFVIHNDQKQLFNTKPDVSSGSWESKS